MATAKCRTQGFRDRWVCHGDFVHFLHTVVGMNTLIDVSARIQMRRMAHKQCRELEARTDHADAM